MATKQQMREYALTLEQFGKEAPDVSYGHLVTLLDHLYRYETTLHRIAENDCNGHPKMKTEYRDGKMYRYEVSDLVDLMFKDEFYNRSYSDYFRYYQEVINNA